MTRHRFTDPANRRGPVAARADRRAACRRQTLQRRPVLCDLVAAQPAVLEHNTSVTSQRCDGHQKWSLGAPAPHR